MRLSHPEANRRYHGYLFKVEDGVCVLMIHGESRSDLLDVPEALRTPQARLPFPNNDEFGLGKPKAPVARPGYFIAYDDCEDCSGPDCERCGGDGLLPVERKSVR